MLSPEEMEDMMARAGRRKKKLAKARRSRRPVEAEGDFAFDNSLPEDPEAMATSAPAPPKGRRRNAKTGESQESQPLGAAEQRTAVKPKARGKRTTGRRRAAGNAGR